MNYTVNKLGKLSAVSIRTLRFYDEIGLLKPAFVAENGYRYYQEPQLVMLQQILFLRELGFELKQIRTIIEQSDYDKVEALQAHKKVLRKNIMRMQSLMKTVDKTINHLQGKQTMTVQEMFQGFSPEQQAKYEDYLIKRCGDTAKDLIAESKKNIKDWTKADFENIKQQSDVLYKELVKAIQKGFKPDSLEAQKLIAQHFQIIKRFYNPSKGVYTGLGQLYVEHPDFRKLYESYHPDLAQFLADAMKVFADRTLTN